MNIDELRLKQSHFESIRQERNEYYKELERLRKNFINLFSIDYLSKMTKEQYVIGQDSHESFCYWIEYKTYNLGVISGARADKYGLYYNQEKNKYVFTNRFDNEENAITILKRDIISLINLGKENDINSIKTNKLSPMFKGKILFLYYPKYYLNIFTDKHINYFLRFLPSFNDNYKLHLLDKRELLINWKNSDEVMKNWSTIEFTDFLYTEFGKPLKNKDIPNSLLDYVEFDYPDINQINISYLELNLVPSIKTDNEMRNKKVKRNYEIEQKRKGILGQHGEAIVLKAEKDFLIKNNRFDLAEKVIKVSESDDSLGYDILSYELDESEKYIEVKSTNNLPSMINFLISSNEYKIAQNYGEKYYIYLIYETNTFNPKIYKMKNPFNNSLLILTPINYRVTGFIS